MSAPDVIIVGGGVIGLSVQPMPLRGEGASVTVLDAGRAGAGVFAAAAGMLAPLAEAGKPGPFVQMALDSLRRWPSFLAQLREDAADAASSFTGRGCCAWRGRRLKRRRCVHPSPGSRRSACPCAD